MNTNRWLIIARFILLIVVVICQKYKYIDRETALVIMFLLLVWSLTNFIKQRKRISVNQKST